MRWQQAVTKQRWMRWGMAPVAAAVANRHLAGR
eukprot:COSAG06_NODE_69097_length_198_cov_150.909091_1_plen_32_part_10